MTKRLIPLGLALLLSAPAYAEITLHEENDNIIRMKGRFDIRAVHTQDQTELVDGTSRLNLNFARDMGDDWEAIATYETGINMVGQTSIAFAGGDTFQTRRSDLLNLRLGYLGVKHSRWGQLTMGKQWGAYYALAGITDMGRTWGGTASGVYNFNGDGGLSGTGRAEQAIQYRNHWGNFSLALQTQQQTSSDAIDEFEIPVTPAGRITEIKYDSTAGGTLSYVLAEDHFVAVAFNRGTFVGTLEIGGSIERDDRIAAIGYRYGEYTDGIYFAAMYADGDFHELDNLNRLMPESAGIEVFASYRGESRFMPYILYNSLEAKGRYAELYAGDEFHRQFVALGAVYWWGEQTSLYLDIRIDSSSISGPQSQFEDDGAGLGMRYSF